MKGGILLLDKPLGMSSNAALQRVRRIFGGVKAGHTGSLDPLATGMLPVCLDEATKIAGDLLAGNKCYAFTVRLGTRTATGDAEGDVIEGLPVPILDTQRMRATIASFVGPRRQVPPMYSALKRAGVPLYQLARRGEEVVREARDITILSLELEVVREGELDLRVRCSKGTYVRTLAEEIGTALGTCAHVGRLRREYVEPFAAEPLRTLEALEAADPPQRTGWLLPADSALPHLATLRLHEAQLQRIRHGQPVDTGGQAGRVRLYAPDGDFIGLGEIDARGVVHPRRLMASNAPQPPDQSLDQIAG